MSWLSIVISMVVEVGPLEDIRENLVHDITENLKIYDWFKNLNAVEILNMNGCWFGSDCDCDYDSANIEVILKYLRNEYV